MRADDVVYWLHGDHLGSTSLTTDISGTVVAQQRYEPYGKVRWVSGTLPTEFEFTGQRAEDFGLIDFHARYYSPKLGRFVSPDTIVPGFDNPQNLNRYSYVRNNALRYTDPTGHYVFEEEPDDQYSWPAASRPSSSVILGTNQDSFADKSQWREAGIHEPIVGLYGSAVLVTGFEIAATEVWNILVSLLLGELTDGDADELEFVERARGSLSDAEARAWYNERVSEINTDGPLTREFAEQVSSQRNAIRAQARALMADRNKAALLDVEHPIKSFEYYVEKYSVQGYSGEALWERIIKGSVTTNPKVNALFEPK